MGDNFLPLIDGEYEIEPADSPADDLLYRQIPSHLLNVQTGVPSVGAFGPLDADRGAPSFAQSSKVSAIQSFQWHNDNAPKVSLCVFACSVSEVIKTGTRAIDDEASALEAGAKRSPGHAYIDYRHLEKPEKKAVRAHLLMCAIERKQIHP